MDTPPESSSFGSIPPLKPMPETPAPGPAPALTPKEGSKGLDRILNLVIVAAALFVVYKAYAILTRHVGPPVKVTATFQPGQTFSLTSSGKIRFRFDGSEKAKAVLSSIYETDATYAVGAEARVKQSGADGTLFDVTVSHATIRGKVNGKVYDVDTSRQQAPASAGYESRAAEDEARSYIRFRRVIPMKIDRAGGISFPGLPGDSFFIHNPLVFVLSLPPHPVATGESWEGFTEVAMPGLGGRLGQVKAISTLEGMEKLDGVRCARIAQDFEDDHKNPQLLGAATLWLEPKRNSLMKSTMKGILHYREDISDIGERVLILVEFTSDVLMRKRQGA